jgi:hypothetical protein
MYGYLDSALVRSLGYAVLDRILDNGLNHHHRYLQLVCGRVNFNLNLETVAKSSPFDREIRANEIYLFVNLHPLGLRSLERISKYGSGANGPDPSVRLVFRALRANCERTEQHRGVVPRAAFRP